MAYGTFNVSGDDVVEALTEQCATTNYERRLNDDGERLADLIAERLMQKLLERLSKKED